MLLVRRRRAHVSVDSIAGGTHQDCSGLSAGALGVMEHMDVAPGVHSAERPGDCAGVGTDGPVRHQRRVVPPMATVRSLMRWTMSGQRGGDVASLRKAGGRSVSGPGTEMQQPQSPFVGADDVGLLHL